MPGSVSWLADGPDVVEDLDVFGSVSPIRAVTEATAAGQEWTGERRTEIQQLFDSMAAGWSGGHADAAQKLPLLDGLKRGNVAGDRVVELGAGSGLGTVDIVSNLGPVIGVDLSMNMLREQPAGTPLVQADASTLPFADRSIDTLVLVNMFLFPAEVDRVLRPDGALLWVNTIGPETPIYLAPETVVASLPGRWRAEAAKAGSGIWASIRRD